MGTADERTDPRIQRRETPPVRPTADLGSDIGVGEDTDGFCIRRKELAANKLNVVGEEHTESDDWRQGESYVAWDKTTGGYWTEHEFRTEEGPGDDLGLLFKSEMAELVHQKHRRSPLESLVESCKLLRKTSLIEPATGEEADLAEEIESTSQLVEDQTLRLASLKEEDNTLSYLLDQAQKICADLEGPQQDDLRESKAKLSRVLGILQTLPTFKAGQVLGKAEEALEVLDGLIEDFADVETEDALVLARSAHMVNSARVAKATLGVWKIGVKHVADDFPVLGDSGVNTLTQTEFEETYGDDVEHYNWPDLNEVEGEQPPQWGRGGDKEYWERDSRPNWAKWFDDQWAE